MPASTTTVSVPIRSPLFLFCNNKKGKYNTWIPQYLSCPVPLKRKKKKPKLSVFLFFFSILHLPRTWRYSDIPRVFFFFVCYTDRCSAFFLLLLFAFSLSYAEQCFGVSFPYSWASLLFCLLFSDVLTSFFFFSCFFLEAAFFSLCFFFFFSVPPRKKKQWPAFEQQRKAAFWTTKQMRTQKHSGRTREKKKKNWNPPKRKKEKREQGTINNEKKKNWTKAPEVTAGRKKGRDTAHKTITGRRKQFSFCTKNSIVFFFFTYFNASLALPLVSLSPPYWTQTC